MLRMLGESRLLGESRVVLFVVNAPEFFLSHRLPLAISLQTAGFQVHVATANGPDVERIKDFGFTHHVVPFTRSGQNPINELLTLLCLVKLFRRIAPELVHLITIKPVLYGGIAARFSAVKCVVGAVSGLGTVYLADSVMARLRRWLISRLYRAAFKHKHLAVIFQNQDDRDALLKLEALQENQARLIRGSGVLLADYHFIPEPKGDPVVVMAARLLKDKGVLEFFEAAKILRQRGVNVEMRLIGAPDPGNPTSVSQVELSRLSRDSGVRLLGFRKDIAQEYSQANLVCLPSYREGLPKSLVEAAACGRAVVTTDVPGCRDAIIDGETGLLVSVGNSVELADAIALLTGNPEQRQKMGQAGRALAEQAFAIEKIVDQHNVIYQELLNA